MVYQPGKESKATYQFFKLTKFYKFTKATEEAEATEPEPILTLGLPEQKKDKGCLAKYKKNFVYEEAPIVHSYKNRGMSDAEIMLQEEEESASAPANVPKWVANLSKKSANNGGALDKSKVFKILGAILAAYAVLAVIIAIALS
jgi:hypothetical protein